MCRFFSFIATKDKLIAGFGVDSHDDLLAIHGIKDDSMEPDFVRCELVPNWPISLDFKSWTFNVDQDLIPDWFDEDEWKERAVKYLEGVPVITDNIKIFSGNAQFLTGKIEKLVGCANILYMLGDAEIEVMSDFSQVREMFNSSRVGEMHGNSQVGGLFDESRVGEMHGNSHIWQMFNSSRIERMYSSSYIEGMLNDSLIEEMYNNSQVKAMFNRSRIGKMFNNSRVDIMYDNSRVETKHDNSQVVRISKNP